jgi:hypothetical protein
MRQVFQRNRTTGAFGTSNNLLGNRVVGMLFLPGVDQVSITKDTIVVGLRRVFAKPNRLFKLVAVGLGRLVGIGHLGKLRMAAWAVSPKSSRRCW